MTRRCLAGDTCLIVAHVRLPTSLNPYNTNMDYDFKLDGCLRGFAPRDAAGKINS